MREKFYFLTTIPNSLNFFKSQYSDLNKIYDVTLISSEVTKLKEIAESSNVKYKVISMKREISIFHDLISLFNLIFFFSKEKPFAIHCNTPKASLLGLLAGYITRIPIRIYYIHGLRYEGTKGFKRKLLIILEKLSCKLATNLIAVSHGVKETVNNELSNKKVKVIHNGSADGIDINKFKIVNPDFSKKDLNIDEDDFVYGFVGRLVADKGINELVQAFKLINQKYENTKLILVGRYENELDPLSSETLLEIKNNKNIIETGYQTDIQKYLLLMNVFVSPSYREGFGVSLLEANIMGISVIASNITGYNEIVKNNFNGFLIEKKNIKQLLNKMEYVYLNIDLLDSMKDNCINLVHEKYNQIDVKNSAIEYYKKFLNK